MENPFGVDIPFDDLGRRLQGRTAVVTGAAQGIGAAIARRLAWEGAAVVMTDLESQAERMSAIVEQLELAGASIASHLADASLPVTADETLATAVAEFGKVDILVNNVGGGILKPFVEKTEEDWQQEIERNLIPTIRYCQSFVPHFQSNGYGRIVNIGAESVRNGLWDHSTYNAAKGGVHGMGTTLARELAADGITVNAVAPSIVEIEVVKKLIAEGHELPKRYISLIPMGRAATVDEVAAAVAFLASDDASFVTGQVLSVNGGSSML